MEIVKTYECLLNLTPNEIYNDIDIVVKNKLRLEYERKCRQGSLILEILDIVQRSQAVNIRSDPDGNHSVSVQFTARALIYNEGDILLATVNCVTKSKDIICSYGEHTVIPIKGVSSLRTVISGQMLPVVIQSLKYNFNMPSVTVNAHPYDYTNSFTMYKIIDAEAFASELVEDAREMMKLAEAKLEEHPKNRIKFFSDLFYPYKQAYSKQAYSKQAYSKQAYSKQAYSKQAYSKQAYSTVDYSIKSAKGILLRHPIINKYNDEIMNIEDISGELFDPRLVDFKVVNVTFAEAMVELINDRTRFLRLLNDMCVAFNSETLINSHNNIWEIYNHVKK